MNAKTIFLLCALASVTAGSTFGMETPPILQRRAKSLPILDSHKSKLIADEDAEEQDQTDAPSAVDRILNQAKTSKPSKDKSSCGTCCKTFKIFLEILKQAADERSIQ